MGSIERSSYVGLERMKIVFPSSLIFQGSGKSTTNVSFTLDFPILAGVEASPMKSPQPYCLQLLQGRLQ